LVIFGISTTYPSKPEKKRRSKKNKVKESMGGVPHEKPPASHLGKRGTYHVVGSVIVLQINIVPRGHSLLPILELEAEAFGGGFAGGFRSDGMELDGSECATRDNACRRGPGRSMTSEKENSQGRMRELHCASLNDGSFNQQKKKIPTKTMCEVFKNGRLEIR
jgi:hypothetical protein